MNRAELRICLYNTKSLDIYNIMSLLESMAIRKRTALEFSWIPALMCLSLHKETRTVPVLVAIILFQLIINYSLNSFRWHLENNSRDNQGNGGQLPPQYPSFFPYVSNALSFVCNNANFIQRATLTSSRISFLGFDIYAFQDRQTVAKIWKQSTLSSPISMFIYVLKYFFGLPDSVVSVYRADDSGPFPKPYSGSNVLATDRIDHITHHGFLRALGGPGLLPTSRRYMNALAARMHNKNISSEWVEMADFSNLFQEMVGASLIECVYGPSMLRLNPKFMEDLWGFDLKRWYTYAREHFDDSHISSDGDGDPYWGSNLMRYRQEKLLAVKNHDDDALARMDLGLAWGAVGNTIPCAMLSAFHLFSDPDLLRRVRNDINLSFGDQQLQGIDPNKLTKRPLLSSIYAETLRFYVKTYFVVSSPHTDVHLGRWTLPKSRIGLMNAGVSHMDSDFWNSRDGKHPVTTFWADRFIIDQRDPQSGPIASEVRESPEWMGRRRDNEEKARMNSDPFFSMEGTEGSWFPYGGGHSICPGRFLAKNVILFTCALLAKEYDVEMLTDKIEMSTWRFGLGVGGLKHPLPFRIRKRNA
ncbi:Cholesterol 7-alpha-monooxygenase [Lachnellula suecica]|uniref:Cholesterol 7-alpha-monooxygenase n=1 Tax=Lachnellula suecica TaxID=602035 RepID=A0A8T9CAR7_9HELO|nr:Cholesterol 7-alpha-monooxygenase [Lachnellula suecica]